MTKKKNIPDAVRSIVLGEAGYQCAYCGQRDGMNLTLHHIISERDGGKAEAANLIALCFNCHHRVEDTKTIPEKEIRKLKRHLVKQRLTQAGVNALKIAYKNPFGVIATPFSVQHLVDEKLIRHVETQMSYGSGEGETEATALYRITKKGKEIAERWILYINKCITSALSVTLISLRFIRASQAGVWQKNESYHFNNNN